MLETVRTALVVAPHPDDEVLGVGGTIARLAAQGSQVHVAILTRGTSPRFSEDFAESVRREAADAHRLLGVTHTHYCGFPAAELDQVPHADLNGKVSALIEQLSPDTLFIPFLGDVHLDHQLAFTSAMVAARPLGENAPRRILAYETLSETNWFAPGITPMFAPTVFIDIGTTLETKLKAFATYQSQVKAFPHERSEDAIRALAQLRGATVCRMAAEAFMLVRLVD
jgi:LmbE family N-acetylglucosaminyl deacetylase